jgi:biotin transporter BioY
LRLVESGVKVQQRIKRKSLAGQCVLLVIGLQLLFVSAFVSVQLPTATEHNLINLGRSQAQQLIGLLPETARQKVYKSLPDLALPLKNLRYDTYTPQAPMAIFIGYVLGYPIATIAAVLFLLAGTIGPFFGVYIFASGGGADYYTQPGFGYLIGMVVATFLVGKITEKETRTSVRQVAALVAGIVSLHVIGLVYVLGCSLLFGVTESTSGPDWLPWVFEQARNLSWYPLPYDAIFGLALIGLGFPIRYLVGVLSAPDIGLKSQADILAQQRMEELLR